MTRTPSPLTYFAVIHGDVGYALDAWPEERAGYLRELGSRIIGEYLSQEAARGSGEPHAEKGED